MDKLLVVAASWDGDLAKNLFTEYAAIIRGDETAEETKTDGKAFVAAMTGKGKKGKRR